jgi:hypothetical protein
MFYYTAVEKIREKIKIVGFEDHSQKPQHQQEKTATEKTTTDEKT